LKESTCIVVFTPKNNQDFMGRLGMTLVAGQRRPESGQGFVHTGFYFIKSTTKTGSQVKITDCKIQRRTGR
jgi:hypothetical protein